MKHIGLYLKSEYLSSLNGDELKLLFQEFRMINLLEFWLGMQLRIKDEESKILNFRNRIELFFVAISVYNEAIKEFTNKMANKLLSQCLDKKLKEEIEVRQKRYLDWKKDEFLYVVNVIRNEISFHLKDSIYKEFIKDGLANTDLLIGIGTSDKKIDFCFTEPYTIIFSKIASLCPEDVKNNDPIDWVQSRIISEIKSFVNFLRNIVSYQIKGKTYKKI